MSKRAEETISAADAGPLTAFTPPVAVPVQQTNILQILGQHLPTEHMAIDAKIEETERNLAALKSYKALLKQIADVSGVKLA